MKEVLFSIGLLVCMFWIKYGFIQDMKYTWYEIRHGTLATVFDQVWHWWIFDWILPNAHFYVCQWAHINACTDIYEKRNLLEVYRRYND